MRYTCFNDPQDESPFFHCDGCGVELYEYDDCFLYGGMILCEYCASKRDDEYDWKTPAYELEDYYKRIYEGEEP